MFWYRNSRRYLRLNRSLRHFAECPELAHTGVRDSGGVDVRDEPLLRLYKLRLKGRIVDCAIPRVKDAARGLSLCFRRSEPLYDVKKDLPVASREFVHPIVRNAHCRRVRHLSGSGTGVLYELPADPGGVLELRRRLELIDLRELQRRSSLRLHERG